jgi:antibiotic biosynthesis monooxygenase (ABM) superfamily enzyme
MEAGVGRCGEGHGYPHDSCADGEGEMISRVWHGWTTPENADAYERVVTTEVMPAIAAREIAGYRGAHVLRRALDDAVEFTTIIWFDSIDNVRDFMGEDYEVAHVPPQAQAVLARFDDRAQHYDVVMRPEE